MQIADQPRSRLLALGADCLTDAELLAVCLGTGKVGVNALQLARELLDHFGTIAGLLDAEADVLLAWPGLGPAKVAILKASATLTERCGLARLSAGPLLTRSDAVRGYLRAKLGRAEREIFACLFLDSRHHLLAYEALFYGTLDRASVHPREILRRALELNAGAVIFAHNRCPIQSALFLKEIIFLNSQQYPQKYPLLLNLHVPQEDLGSRIRRRVRDRGTQPSSLCSTVAARR